MDDGGDCVALRAPVRRFNGAFFKDRRAFPLKREQIRRVDRGRAGGLGERGARHIRHLAGKALSPADRARLGAHYTPRPYVERLVIATVMDPLRAEWDAARAAAEAARGAGDADGARLEIAAFHERLTRTRVLDPACGTGNFLYVALELMKGLEGEVLDAYAELRGGAGVAEFADLTVRGVDPRQFLGLELNPRAAAITELVLWIGYLQASFRRGGYEARTPVLEDHGGIRVMDAVLMPGAVPRRPDWPAAEFIVGNPPFLGGKDIRGEYGDAYAEALWAAHPQMNDAADFVMYWWDHAAELLTAKARRCDASASLPPTPSPKPSAVASRRADCATRCPCRWSSRLATTPGVRRVEDAAMVRIAMTVAQAGSVDGELHEVIREEAVDTDAPVIETRVTLGRINADLTVGADVTKAKPLRANDFLCSPGMKLHGAGSSCRTRRRSIWPANPRGDGGAGRRRDAAAQVGGRGVIRPGLRAHIRPISMAAI